MLRTTASQARKDLFRLLDAVERGEEVVLERKGVRFRLSRDEGSGVQGSDAQEVAEPRSPVIIEDPTLLSGEWTWVSDEDGQLTFQPR